MDKFISIAITPPYFYPGEGDAIARKLESREADYVHIRKPGSAEADVLNLILSVPTELRQRLTIHDHPGLACHVGGVHLNSRMKEVAAGWKGRVSASLHSLEEMEAETRAFDYVTLSPIFPSISKPGYRPQYDAALIREFLKSGNRPAVIALGGVEPSRVEEVKALGFDGCAMLGAAWRREIDPADFRLQFITNPLSVEEAVAQASEVLNGGCRWVQLRWKDAGDDDVAEAARRIAPLCRRHGAVFIIDDCVHLVGSCGADGVHLGKNDMAVDEARKILGPGYIIGATANTPDDIFAAATLGADYIGFGPFRFTATKKNLSPVLGLEGYRRAIGACQERGIRLPLVAIGGITEDDIPEIMHTGVGGIAISGAIIRSVSPAYETKKLYKIISENNSYLK